MTPEDQLADTLIQRMAEHAPVTQSTKTDGSGHTSWLIKWGEYMGSEASTRFEAVMQIVDDLFDRANADHDPRTDAVDPTKVKKTFEPQKGSLDVDKADPPPHSDNDAP